MPSTPTHDVGTSTYDVLHSFGTKPILFADIEVKLKSLTPPKYAAVSGGWAEHSPTELEAVTTNPFVGGNMVATIEAPELVPGTRVELAVKPTAVTLRGRTGTIVREDEDDRDYVIVRLDTPALYRHLNGEVEELPEIVVMTDNLRALSD